MGQPAELARALRRVEETVALARCAAVGSGTRAGPPILGDVRGRSVLPGRCGTCPAAAEFLADRRREGRQLSQGGEIRSLGWVRSSLTPWSPEGRQSGSPFR